MVGEEEPLDAAGWLKKSLLNARSEAKRNLRHANTNQRLCCAVLLFMDLNSHFHLEKEQNKSGQQSHLKFIWRLNAICQRTWTAKQVVLKSEYEFSFGFRKSIGGTDRGWIHTALLINPLLYPFQHCKSTL